MNVLRVLIHNTISGSLASTCRTFAIGMLSDWRSLRCGGDALTWKNRSLNTGCKSRRGCGFGVKKHNLGTGMGKSNGRSAKKPAPRSRAKATANGSGSRTRKSASPQAAPRAKKSGSGGSGKPIVLPEGYRPNDSEPFMNERHKLYFRNKLVAWKEEIVRQNRETLHVLHEDSAQHADIADRATSETDRALELRARDRQRKLIAKIDAALARIEDGTYGYCEETGEPIGLKRLDARPIATLSLEAQERHERREKVFRED